MGKSRITINWLAFEGELRDILRDPEWGADDAMDALRCIDEALARYTGRGNAMQPVDDVEYGRLCNQYPTHFDWENRG